MMMATFQTAVAPILFVLFCTFSLHSALPATPTPPAENSTTYRLNEVIRGAKTLDRFTVRQYNHITISKVLEILIN